MLDWVSSSASLKSSETDDEIGSLVLALSVLGRRM